jgi:hypothetical protein
MLEARGMNAVILRAPPCVQYVGTMPGNVQAQRELTIQDHCCIRVQGDLGTHTNYTLTTEH